MITIRKNPNGDTRTANKNVTYEEFQKANDMHIQDVRNVMNEMALQMMLRGDEHDWSKKALEKTFYEEFKNTLENGNDFTKGFWYDHHVHQEKHHPLSCCHEDINLLDIIEMIVDCVCAGKSRSGKIRELEVSDEILSLALDNTVKLIDAITMCE